MFKIVVVVVGLSAAASASCAGCADNVLTFDSWKIEPIDERTNLLTTEFTFVGAKPIRMLDASAGFGDVLGERIASFAIERDVSLAAGDKHTQVGRWGQFTFERLLDVRPEDVEATVCVKAVVYQDGTVEKF